MKHNYLLFVAMAILAGMLSASSVSTVNMGSADNKMKLVKYTSGTRSATATEIEASINNHILAVTISNYTGMAWVDVNGMGKVRQQVVHVNGAGLIEMDLSTLAHGVYQLCVTLEDGLYEGYFEY